MFRWRLAPWIIVLLAIGALLWWKRERPSQRVEIKFVGWNSNFMRLAPTSGTFPVFSVRNETPKGISIQSINFKESDPTAMIDGATAIQPYSTAELTAYCSGSERPRLAFFSGVALEL